MLIWDWPYTSGGLGAEFLLVVFVVFVVLVLNIIDPPEQYLAPWSKGGHAL